VWINSATPMAVSVDHGWRPFGRPMLVTRAEGNTIFELDGRPALEAYLSERGAALKEDGRSWGEKCMERPIGLPADEFRIIQTHPVVGSELLRAWGLEEPARFVLQHHERVDGSGYPHGLRGKAIALEARIIHVADAFVAMTLDRPYRLAMAREDALAELVRHRGTQFDASVVDALLALERPGALPAAA